MAYRGSLTLGVFSLMTIASGVWAQEPTGITAPPPAAPSAPTAAPQNSVQASSVQEGQQPVVVAPQPAPPTIYLHPEPAPPPVARTYHVHDGFYARLNLGFGALGTKVDVPGGGNDRKADGDTLALDLAVGYSPSPGIAIGGAVLFESLPSANFDDPSTSEANVGTLLIGPFFDGYPNARGGFHLGGALGLAQDRLSRNVIGGFKTANGFGLAGWIGYDLWVADEWSVGGLVRLMGTRGSADAEATASFNGGTANIATQSIQLMITTLYH